MSRIIMVAVGLVILGFLFIRCWRRADAREIEMRRMDMEETKRNAHTVAQLQQLSNTDKERKAKVYAFLYGQKRRNKR